MARNLQAWQRQLIVHMTLSRKSLTISQIAKVANCKIYSSLATPKPPRVPAGQPPIITPVMLDALCDHLAEKPSLYVEEMAIFLWDEFTVLPSQSSVKRALARAGWNKRKPSKERKNKTLSYEIFTSISCRNFPRTTWSLLMNRDVINVSGTGGLVGHHSA
ncbi:hypothetical protein N7528_009226 [Penicillium herquei]|nr:hypothetical protein N7528_009226 [Penicillium herquei]